MSESISQRTSSMFVSSDSFHVSKVMDAILADMTAIRATVAKNVIDVAALAAAVDVLAAKLNADGGVTDVNYSIVNAAAVTAATPSALITIS